MAGSSLPGPIGSPSNNPVIDSGTSAISQNPPPGPVGQNPAAPSAATPEAEQNDPKIEVLDLEPAARKAAYALKKKHPTVIFTSGRRDKGEQASAMASNVVANRQWIKQTYAQSKLRDDCQKWVDDHPDKKTHEEIKTGLLSVLNQATSADLGRLSKHLSGMAFDVQPVEQNADEIKKTIKSLEGLEKFLDTEGGLVRWHAQFSD